VLRVLRIRARPIPERRQQLKRSPRTSKKRRDLITYLCFVGVYVQAITTIFSAYGTVLFLARRSRKSSAAASRWRQIGWMMWSACMQ
jgi:hypothetical protein